MKKNEFDTLRVGDSLYSKDGFCGQVTKINRTTERISAIGLGNNVYWKYLHKNLPKGVKLGGIMGISREYDIIETMEFKKQAINTFGCQYGGIFHTK
jgi:hypothetical protein